MHIGDNWESYEFKHENKSFGFLGESAILLVEQCTSLLQMVTFEKYKMSNLSVEWQMFCETNNIDFYPFAKEYGSRWTHSQSSNFTCNVFTISTHY